jgi:hypothetical protein
MNRRFFQRCIVWLLPLVGLQALVPVGFMVAPGQSGIEVAFCPVQSARVVSALAEWKQPRHQDGHSAHHGHATHHAADTSHDSRNGASCPFALVATAIVTPVQTFTTASAVDLGIVDSLRATTPPVVPASDSNRIRGPPQLS